MQNFNFVSIENFLCFLRFKRLLKLLSIWHIGLLNNTIFSQTLVAVYRLNYFEDILCFLIRFKNKNKNAVVS